MAAMPPTRGAERCIAFLSRSTRSMARTALRRRAYNDLNVSELRRFSSVRTPSPFCAFLYPRNTYLHSSRQWRQPKTPTMQNTPQRFFSLSRTQQQQQESTIQGTIGAGPDGVAAEAERVEEMLVAPDHLDDAERHVYNKLNAELQPTKLEVQDISGGCGSMYGIEIASEKFRGLSMVKQQKLVNSVLAEEIKGWHGVQLKTRVPE